MRKADFHVYVQDILEAIKRIDEYIGEMTFEEFSRDKKTMDAVVRNFAVIGEAAKNVPVSVKRKHTEIAWKRMSGMRDKVIHEYFGVDPHILWDTAKSGLATHDPYAEDSFNRELAKVNVDSLERAPKPNPFC